VDNRKTENSGPVSSKWKSENFVKFGSNLRVEIDEADISVPDTSGNIPAVGSRWRKE
jgi:hypothetical protein